MFQMILADDEPVITRGISMLIDWAQLGIEIVACCQDGATAFNEIVSRQPELAILDIAMPKMSGIDILKALQTTGTKTKVIFVSGFQDFSYARDALAYGAVDYLLKPVKKETLLEAVGKCLPAEVGMTAPLSEQPQAAEESGGAALPILPDTSDYQIAAVEILGLAEKSALEQQLISFSVFSRLESEAREQISCTAFQKEREIYILLSEADRVEAPAQLTALAETVAKATGWELGLVLSPQTRQMSAAPQFARRCREKCHYFYFAEQLPSRLLLLEQPVFAHRDLSRVRSLQLQIADAFVGKSWTAARAQLQEYAEACVPVADGKQDAAVYYLLSCLREIADRMAELGIGTDGPTLVDDTLRSAREAASYSALSQVFLEAAESLYGKVVAALRKSDKKDILQATDYINTHYAESLTLEVLASQIHMNSFYFSSYFKKQTGQNFKDYLNKVRMRHALELLINTDWRNYEIAEKVGITDYRYFTELFVRLYGKTPAAYRKEMRESPQEEPTL